MAITLARVREVFDYREDGNLIWKKTLSSFRKKGSVAGTIREDGKVVVSVDRRLYLLHRLIFFWHMGYMPPYIDHKDCNHRNNRIENLRPATKSQNGFNRRAPSHNKSGVKGVHWDKARGKWAAEIKAGGKRVRLGRFENLADAAKAYEKAAIELHGMFARPTKQ